MNAALLVEGAQRRTAGAVSLILTVAAGLLLAGTLISMLFQYSFAALVLSGVLVVVVCGTLGSLLLLRRTTLIWAVVPLLCALFLAVVLVCLLLREVRLSALPFLAFIVIFSGLMTRRQVAFYAALICSLTGIALILLPPLPLPPTSLGPLIPLVQTVGVVTVIVALWQVIDRFIVAQQEALRLTEQRAGEAEHARAEAERARAEAERREAELARLLDLVQSLELPALAIGHGVLLVPLIGSLDSRRMEAIQAALLRNISQSGARTVVFDLTGISDLDSIVARQLVQTGQAIRLLGAQTYLSGVRAGVAQALSELQIALDGLTPVSGLQEVLAGTGSI